jgi:hypothetical protein
MLFCEDVLPGMAAILCLCGTNVKTKANSPGQWTTELVNPGTTCLQIHELINVNFNLPKGDILVNQNNKHFSTFSTILVFYNIINTVLTY